MNTVTQAPALSIHDKFLDFAPKSKEPQFLQDFRERERLRFLVTNPPTTRDEYWKYTRVAKIVNRNFVSCNETYKLDYTSFILPELDAYRLYFVDGAFDAKQSEEVFHDDFIICSMQSAIKRYPQLVEKYLGKSVQKEKEFFLLLNNVLFSNGVFVYLAKGKTLPKVISINHIGKNDNSLHQGRNLFIFEENTEGQIINSASSLSGSDSFTNVHTEFFVGKSSRVAYNLLQNQNAFSDRVEGISVVQQGKSVFTLHTQTFSGRMVRNNVDVLLDGEFCESNLYGIYSCKGQQHVDNHTSVDHKYPNCVSNELYKGIMDEQSLAVFNGKVLVRQDAQKTNAFQNNQNIVLSEKAGIFTKPELEIYADDVKCSHGCTTGQLDDEALFYLQSRGIPLKEAKNMLVYAFLGEVLSKVSPEAVRVKIQTYLSERYENVQHD